MAHQRLGDAACEDEQYREWLLKLQKDGFEIALHNVSHHTSSRNETGRGLEAFYRLFGQIDVNGESFWVILGRVNEMIRT
jgi:hypothetical protein